VGNLGVVRRNGSRARQLALFYDGRGDHQPGHMRRDIALALLQMPLRPV
jgi:hypothetical protein